MYSSYGTKLRVISYLMIYYYELLYELLLCSVFTTYKAAYCNYPHDWKPLSLNEWMDATNVDSFSY